MRREHQGSLRSLRCVESTRDPSGASGASRAPGTLRGLRCVKSARDASGACSASKTPGISPEPAMRRERQGPLGGWRPRVDQRCHASADDVAAGCAWMRPSSAVDHILPTTITCRLRACFPVQACEPRRGLKGFVSSPQFRCTDRRKGLPRSRWSTAQTGDKASPDPAGPLRRQAMYPERCRQACSEGGW